MAIRNLFRVIAYEDIKTNIEALNGTIVEIVLAYATDTEELGIYTGSSWKWIGSGHRELLVDDNGEIMFDENNDVLYEDG